MLLYMVTNWNLRLWHFITPRPTPFIMTAIWMVESSSVGLKTLFKKDMGIYRKGCQTSYLCDSRNGLGTKLTIKIDTTHEMINSLIESLFWSFIFVYFVYFHTSSFKWKLVWCKFVLLWRFFKWWTTHTLLCLVHQLYLFSCCLLKRSTMHSMRRSMRHNNFPD